MGRAFSGAVVETSLASYPGTFFTSAPSRAQAVARYWPTTVAADAVTAARRVRGGDDPGVRPARGGTRHAADAAGRRRGDASGTRPTGGTKRRSRCRCGCSSAGARATRAATPTSGCGPIPNAVAEWLCEHFDSRAVQGGTPRSGAVRRQPLSLPNLRAVNFVVHGILGWGVASNLRLDTQAKGLAELLRSRNVVVPSRLLESGKPAERSLTRGHARPSRPEITDNPPRERPCHIRVFPCTRGVARRHWASPGCVGRRGIGTVPVKWSPLRTRSRYG